MLATTTTEKKARIDAATAGSRLGLISLAAFYVLACAVGWLFYVLERFDVVSEAENLPLGPAVGALIVALALGRNARTEWWSHLRQRPSLATIVVGIGAPIAMTALYLGIAAIAGVPLPDASDLATWYELPVTFILMLILVGIGEEAGWGAFATPIIGRYGGLFTTIVVMAALRVAWHLPMLLDGSLPWFLGAVGSASFQAVLIVAMRRIRGGWMIGALWHAMLNTLGGAFFFTFVEGDDNAMLGYVMGACYLALAVVVLIADRASAHRGRSITTAGVSAHAA